MLCYRCGSHVPDTAETCIQCGNRLDAHGRTLGATSMRRRAGANELEGAPYRAGDKVTERYPVIDIVGPGPCGWVFRCRDEELDVDLALKVVEPRLLQTPEEREQFSRVMKLSRKFTHPSLARAYGDGADAQGRPYFTQPFLDGLTLRKIIDQRISKGQFFTPREVEPVLAQLVKALEAAAAQGPHSDLKPSNIVIQPDLLKVTDYGLALAIPRLPFAQAQKPTIGHRYLAPEYLSGFDVDSRMDQYALGVLVGEMLAGLVPESASSVQPLKSKNEALGPEAEGFYRRALAERPDGRFGSFADLLAEFKKCVDADRPRERARASRPSLPAVPALSMPPPVPEPSDASAQVLRSSEPHPQPSFGEDRPPDATIPISAEELQAHFGIGPSPSAPPAQNVVSKGPLAPRLAPPSVPGSENPTQAFPNILLDEPSAEPGLFGAARREPFTARPQVLFPLLAAAGVLLGILLGWEVLGYVHHMRDKKPAPVKASSTGAPRLTSGAGGSGLAGAGSRPACPDDMRLVPAGAFRMGAAHDDPLKMPEDGLLSAREVGAFCIDALEYPNHLGSLPVVNVTWAEAKQRCEALGRRLCSEPEWEKACKGLHGGREGQLG